MPHLMFTGWLRETDSRAGLSVRCYRLAAAGGSVGDSVEAATFARHFWLCSQRPNACLHEGTTVKLPHLLSVRLLIGHWGEAYWNINGKFWQSPPIPVISQITLQFNCSYISYKQKNTMKSHITYAPWILDISVIDVIDKLHFKLLQTRIKLYHT